MSERVAQAAGDEERGGMRGSCRQGLGSGCKSQQKKIATWEICIRPSTGPTALNQKSGQITGVWLQSVNLSLSRPMP